MEQLDSKDFISCVENVIMQQKKMDYFLDDWKISGRRQFPLLSQKAEKLLILRFQSANVERAYKYHKLIHSKVRNSIQVKTVHMLLFCYMNLRQRKKKN